MHIHVQTQTLPTASGDESFQMDKCPFRVQSESLGSVGTFIQQGTSHDNHIVLFASDQSTHADMLCCFHPETV